MSGGCEWEEDSTDGTQIFDALRKKISSVVHPLQSQSQVPRASHQKIPQQHRKVARYDQPAVLVPAHGGSYSSWCSVQEYAHPVHMPPELESRYTPTPAQQPSSHHRRRDMVRLSTSTNVYHHWEAVGSMPQYKHKYMDKTPHTSIFDSSDVLGFKQQLQKMYMLISTRHNIWEDKNSIGNADRICNDDMDMSPDHSSPNTFDSDARVPENTRHQNSMASWPDELHETLSIHNFNDRENRSLQTQILTKSASSRTQDDRKEAIANFLRRQKLACSLDTSDSRETCVQEVPVTHSVQNNEADYQDATMSSSDSSDSDKDDSVPSVDCSIGALLGHIRSNLVSAPASGGERNFHQPKKDSFSYKKPESNRKSPIQSPASEQKQKLPSPKSPIQSSARLRVLKVSEISSRNEESYQLKDISSNEEPQNSVKSRTQALEQLQTQKFAPHVSRYEVSSFQPKKTSYDKEQPQCNSKSPLQSPGKKAYSSGRAVLDRILSGAFKSNKVSSQSSVEPHSLSGTVDQIEQSQLDDAPNGSRQLHIPSTGENQLPCVNEDNISNKLVDNDFDDLIYEDLEEIGRVMETINSDDITNNCPNENNPNPSSKEKEKSDDTSVENTTSQRDEAEKTQQQVSNCKHSSFSKEREKELRADTGDMIRSQTDRFEKNSKQLPRSRAQNISMKSTVQRGKPPGQTSDSARLSSSSSTSDSTLRSTSEKKEDRVKISNQIKQTVEYEKASRQRDCSTSRSLHPKSENQTSKNHSSSENSKYNKHQTKDDHLDRSSRECSKRRRNKHKHKDKDKSSFSSKSSKLNDECRDKRKHKRKDKDGEYDQRDRKKPKTNEKSSGNLKNGEIEKESHTSNKHMNSSSKYLGHRTDSEASGSSVDRCAQESNIENKDSSVGASFKVACKDRFYFLTKGNKYPGSMKVEDTESDSELPDLMKDVKRSDSPESDHDIQFKDEPIDFQWNSDLVHVDESYLKKAINIVMELIDTNMSIEKPYDSLYDLLNKLDIGVWKDDRVPYLYEVEVNFRRLVVGIENEGIRHEVDMYIANIHQNMKEPLKDFLGRLNLV